MKIRIVFKQQVQLGKLIGPASEVVSEDSAEAMAKLCQYIATQTMLGMMCLLRNTNDDQFAFWGEQVAKLEVSD